MIRIHVNVRMYNEIDSRTSFYCLFLFIDYDVHVDVIVLFLHMYYMYDAAIMYVYGWLQVYPTGAE